MKAKVLQKNIPNEWSATTLGSVASVNPRSEIKLDNDSAVGFISMADVSNDGRVEHVQERLLKDVKKGFTVFEPRDVLLAKITPCLENGKGGLVPSTYKLFFGSTEFHVLRASDKIIPEYIFQIINQLSFRRVAERNMKGSAGQKRVPREFLENFGIKLPPVEEQKKIAEILGSVDDEITKTEEIILKTEELRKGLVQKILGKPQKDWTSTTLGKITNHKSIKNSKNDIKRVVSVTKYFGIVNSLDYFKKQVFSKNISSYKIIDPGDFAYATIHLDEGSIGFLNSEDSAVLSPMYTVFSIDEQKVDRNFLYMVLKSHDFINIYKTIGLGSIDRRRSVSYEKFSKIPIVLPPLNEQQKVTEIISSIDQKILFEKKLKENLTVLKKGLMQDLLTGKVRTI
jgi:type I restriction enzyme S subunit